MSPPTSTRSMNAKELKRLNDIIKKYDRERKVDDKQLHIDIDKKSRPVPIPTECDECGGSIIVVPSKDSKDYMRVCQKCGLTHSDVISEKEVGLGGIDEREEVPTPPPCICGNVKFSFVKEHDPDLGTRVRAVCTRKNCRYQRLFYFRFNRWTDVSKGKEVRGQKWDKMDLLEEDEKINSDGWTKTSEDSFMETQL